MRQSRKDLQNNYKNIREKSGEGEKNVPIKNWPFGLVQASKLIEVGNYREEM